MNTTTTTTRQIIVKRDFAGGTDFSYAAGYFFTLDEAREFVTRLTGGGTYAIEVTPSLTDAMDNGAQIVRVETGAAR